MQTLTGFIPLVTFIGLNAIRILSLISLILVFASTIFVMVYNVKAMNYFEANKGLHVDLRDCDYIEYVFIFERSVSINNIPDN